MFQRKPVSRGTTKSLLEVYSVPIRVGGRVTHPLFPSTPSSLQCQKEIGSCRDHSLRGTSRSGGTTWGIGETSVTDVIHVETTRGVRGDVRVVESQSVLHLLSTEREWCGKERREIGSQGKGRKKVYFGEGGGRRL